MQLRLRVTRRSWQKLFAGKNFVILEVSSSSIIWWMFFIMLFRSFCIFRRSALSQHEFICRPSCFCNILVTGEDGLTKDSKEQLEIITNFFEKTFNKENIDKMEDVKPSKMNDPFTAEEIETATKRLKNNKSPGVDNINAELLKYGPNELHGEIANIFNRIAATGEIPTDARACQDGVVRKFPRKFIFLCRVLKI